MPTASTLNKNLDLLVPKITNNNKKIIEISGEKDPCGWILSKTWMPIKT